MITIIIIINCSPKMKVFQQDSTPQKKRKKCMNRHINMLRRLKLYESSLWIKISVHFHKDPEREYLNVNIDRYDLDSMYFPTTNCRRTDHSRVLFLMSWKYLCLQKDCCKLQKVEEKLFLLDKLQQCFGVVFPSFYFKLAIGEVIFWYMCQKKIRSERPSPIDFSTWTRKGKLVFALFHQGIKTVSLCANDLF